MSPKMRLTLLIGTLILSGCTKFKASNSGIGVNREFFKTGEVELKPSTDKLSSDCLSNSDFDLCIFQKNPMAQTGQSLDLNGANGHRNFGAKLNGVALGFRLENSEVQVLSLKYDRVDLRVPSQFKSDLSDSASYLEQLSAYYWSYRMTRYLKDRLGSVYPAVGRVKIYADDVFTGYSSKNNSIHLKKSPQELADALSSDVIHQLLAQALLFNMTHGQSASLKDTQNHQACALSPKGCCSSKWGCSQALSSAFGDYMVGVMNPDRAVVGEQVAKSLSGQNICGQKRDLRDLKNLSLDLAFTSCSGKLGFVPLMGSWYASVWWSIRGEAASRFSSGASDIDRLFAEHMGNMQSSWTFQTASSMAQTLAGKYQSIVKSALSSHQL